MYTGLPYIPGLALSQGEVTETANDNHTVYSHGTSLIPLLLVGLLLGLFMRQQKWI